MNNLPQDLVLRHEEIPDDEALLDELLALVEQAIHAQPRASPRKNVKKIISAIVFYGLLVSLIAGAFFLSRSEKKPIFGYSFMNVLTWSMEPEIPQGSLVIIKETDPKAIQIGDDITFTIDPETSVTHRVIGIMEDYENSGERGFETQGIDNDTPDFDIVPAINVVGVVRFHVPRLGGWLDWLGSNLLLVGGFLIGIILLIFFLKGALKKPPKSQNTQVYTGSKGEARVNKTTHSERESNHMKGKFKRILSSTGAIAVAAALAVGGTFAYRNWERKSNVVTGKAQYQARLVEEYEKNPEWVKDEEIEKNVRVRNMGGVGQFSKDKNWGDIYVGIRLLEYMDITPYNYTYVTSQTSNEPIRFMVDTRGEFVRFPVSAVDFTKADKAELRADIKDAYEWEYVIAEEDARDAFIDSLVNRKFMAISGLYDKDAAGDPLEYYYLPTQAGDPNGQYGAYVVKEAKEDIDNRRIITGGVEPKRLTANGQEKAYDVDYLKHYQPHLWTEGAETSLVHEYIEIILGAEGSHWVYLSDYDESKNYDNGVWILDDSADSVGWAYWSAPLKPGDYTDLLIDHLLPKVTPEDLFYYDLYVLMEAYSKDEIPEGWPIYEAPAQVFSVSPASGEVELGKTQGFNSTLDGKDATAATEWRLYDEPMKYNPDTQLISPMSIETPNSTAGGSMISGTSTVTLTVGTAETAKKLYIIAIHGEYWKQIEITVVDNTPPATETTIPTIDTDPPGSPYVPKVVIGTDDADTSLKSDFVTFQTNYNGNDGTLIGIVTDYAYMEHNGYIYLKDIIDDEYLDGVAIDYPALSVSSGGELNSSNIWIDEDERTGEDNPAIIYNYVPSSLDGIPSPFYFDAKIRLTRTTVEGVDQEVTINVRLTYGTEAKQFAPFVVNF